MKLANRSLLLLFTLGATFAYAQQNIPQIQHVIVVIQENRTPTNLFNNGAHVVPQNNQGLCGTTQVSLTPYGLAACFDPDHSHSVPFPSWSNMYDNGKMDGACNNHVYVNQGCSPPTYPQYTYVANAQCDGQQVFLAFLSAFLMRLPRGEKSL